MKDKMIVFLTLSVIFSLFLYYKINPSNLEYQTIKSTEKSIDTQMIDEIFIIDENIHNKLADNKFELEQHNSCTLGLDEVNVFSFSEAFKHYRICLGKNKTFTWNNKTYSTLLLDEVNNRDINSNAISNIDSSLDRVDKIPLQLEDEIIVNDIND